MLVIVGVHSPKFVHEADPVALAAAVERYEVHHPVLDDPELTTWSAYTARAWPTLVVIDPEGYVVAHLAGEGHAHAIAALVGELVAEHEAKGTLHRGDGPYVPPPAEPLDAAVPREGRATARREPAGRRRRAPQPRRARAGRGDAGPPDRVRRARARGRRGRRGSLRRAERSVPGARGAAHPARVRRPGRRHRQPRAARRPAGRRPRDDRRRHGRAVHGRRAGQPRAVAGGQRRHRSGRRSGRSRGPSRVGGRAASTRRGWCGCPRRGTSRGRRTWPRSSSRWPATTRSGRSTTSRGRSRSSPGR